MQKFTQELIYEWLEFILLDFLWMRATNNPAIVQMIGSFSLLFRSEN